MGEDTKKHEESSPLHHKRTTSLEEEVHGKHYMNDRTHHGDKRAKSSHISSMVAAAIVTILILAGIAFLVVYLIYKPHKPRYTVLTAAVLVNPTLSNNTIMTIPSPPPYLVSTSIQFSIVTTNPNKRVSIYYDRISAFVTYHNQMITRPVDLPPFYHEKHSSVQLAPVLGGVEGVPVSQEVLYGLGRDEATGVVGMRLVFLGRLRWKAGAITTAHYHFYIHCDVLLRLTQGFVGQVPLLANPTCKVDV